MPDPASNDEIYEEARHRVKGRKSFYSHLTAWAIVSVILIIVWSVTNFGGYPWFLWPVCIWGAFVFYNYLNVFIITEKYNHSAIEKEVEKIKRERSQTR